MDHLNALPEHYKRSFMHAYDLMKSGRLVKKENMDYWDFNFLDDGFEDKVNTDLEKSYYNHKKIYDGLTDKFKKQF